MRIADKTMEAEEGVNMTPLIDMVFLLLIFFLVATTVAQEEREAKIQLPATSSIQPLSAEPRQIIINIKDDGTTIVSGRTYDAASLLELLTNAVRNNPEREVLVRADERGLVRYLAGVVALCRQAGVKEFKIGYLAETPSN